MFAVVTMFGSPTMAFAQSQPAAPPSSPGPADSVITPPKLVEKFEATYPPAALDVRVEGVVGLRLTISKLGEVTKVEVVESAGNGFDEAAMEAAVKFRFEPARKGTTPIASRILYRVEFKLPPQTISPPPPADGTSPPPPPVRPLAPPPPPVRPLAPPPPPAVVAPKTPTDGVDSDEPVDSLGPIAVSVHGCPSAPARRRSFARA